MNYIPFYLAVSQSIGSPQANQLQKFLISSQRHSVTASQRNVLFQPQKTLLILVYFLLIGLTSKAVAQPCDPLADFTFTISGCNVEFQPVSIGSGISHFWTFQSFDNNGPIVSASNIATPLHTFGIVSPGLRTITHTVTIGGVIHTCTKYIAVNCNEGCEERAITYVVNGCTVTFYSSLPGGTWYFGDGGFSSQTNPTYTYTSSGDYIVTYTDLNGNTCRKTIRVACDQTSLCCTPAFTAEIKRNCSELNLSLSAECTSNGTHSWSILPISPNTCINLVNFFQGMPTQGMIQITNINTCEVTALVITHNFTCSNGTVLSQTQTIPITDPGIYIGKNGMTTLLTDYNCVLPGAVYNGPCTVYSSGIVRVNKDFTFSSATVRVQPGLSGFDVTNNFTINQNTVISGNAEPECNCLWRGIYVYGAVNITTDTDASIQDALYAIRAGFKNKLSIKKTLFAKNYIGIRGTDGPFNLLAFEENEFDGNGPLKDICTLEPLNDIINRTFPIGWCEEPVQYSSGRGFAGMYLRDAGFVDLLPLPYANQNLFYNLAIGIFAKDTEIKIRQNSRFKDIIPIPLAYDLGGGNAIRYIDTDNKGANGFRFKGNGKFFGLDPDFDNCSFGICLASSVTADVNSGTRIGINDSRFLKTQIGVYLDNLCFIDKGVFTGRKINHEWRGIWDNYIEVDPTTGDQFVIPFSVPNAGIVVADMSPTQSAPEIWQNTIDVNQDNLCGASFGIRAFGLTFFNPLLNQVDINRNRIDLNSGLSGINVNLYDGVQIHDNSDAAFPGAGIFLNYQHFHQTQDCGNNVDYSTGVLLNAGRISLVGCNDITSTVPGNYNMRMTGQTNGTFVQNNLSGGRFGAHITSTINNPQRFACNTMSGYSENGLFLNGIIGAQGTFGTMTHGNKWINNNPAITDAFIDILSNPSLSFFYVTTRPWENPTTNTILNTWFIPNVPNNVDPICFYECPITAPLAFESELTYADTAIAEGTLIYQEYPEANQWINERNLLEKLSLNPELSSGSLVMADFLDSHDQSAMGQLVEVNSALGSMFQLSEGNKSALTSIAQTTKVLLDQLFYLDSIAGIESSPEWEEINIAQRDSLAELLEEIQKEADSLANEISAELRQQGTIVLASLNDIVPTNDFEFNEKYVLGVYLNFLVSENQLLPGTADSLFNIGRECPFISGPCVYNARNLYGRMTGIALPDVDCPVLENRNKRSDNATLSDVLIYPNPSNDILIIRLLADIEPGTSHVKISDVLGRLVFDAEILAGVNEIPTKHLLNGTYFVQIVQNGLEVLTTSVLIQH
ncbi:MAG: T9SS type A sorting domain-containing protein [Chitinophagales bacterium]|nr:T9SS type A sorting domain-containing protein [Chitinophagales bacterium]